MDVKDSHSFLQTLTTTLKSNPPMKVLRVTRFASVSAIFREVNTDLEILYIKRAERETDT
jgi:hypothetical protein